MPANPAAAAVTSSVDEGALTVTGDAEDDLIAVACGAGDQVEVNGGPPDSGPVACADLTSITVRAGGGHDEVDLRGVGKGSFPSVAAVSIAGEDGDDEIVGSKLADTLAAGTGDDVVRGRPSAGDILDGGDGTDLADLRIRSDLTLSDGEAMGAGGTVPFTSFELVTVVGSQEAERLDAASFSGAVTARLRGGDDAVVAGAGLGDLNGGGGADLVLGGASTDTLDGGAGDDVVRGRGGADILRDWLGADRLSGGPGRDLFQSVIRDGNVLRGGPGVDDLSANVAARAKLTDHRLLATGRARLRSVDRVTLLPVDPDGMHVQATAFSGDLAVPVPTGSDDVVLAGSGDDVLAGGDGDDVLSGGPGRDRLDGGDGHDICDGGPGRDRLIHCE